MFQTGNAAKPYKICIPFSDLLLCGIAPLSYRFCISTLSHSLYSMKQWKFLFFSARNEFLFLCGFRWLFVTALTRRRQQSQPRRIASAAAAGDPPPHRRLRGSAAAETPPSVGELGQLAVSPRLAGGGAQQSGQHCTPYQVRIISPYQVIHEPLTDQLCTPYQAKFVLAWHPPSPPIRTAL
jgi:hypothetical protein